MTPTPEERHERAWHLVRAYIREHYAEVDSDIAEKLLTNETLSPLGTLIMFEMFRLGRDQPNGKMSLNEMSGIIARRIPDGVVQKRITSSGLFYLTNPKRPDQKAKSDSLVQLSLGLGWPLPWLREVNRELADASGDTSPPTPEVMRLAHEMNANPLIVSIVDRVLAMEPTQQRAVATFVLSLPIANHTNQQISN